MGIALYKNLPLELEHPKGHFLKHHYTALTMYIHNTVSLTHSFADC